MYVLINSLYSNLFEKLCSIYFMILMSQMAHAQTIGAVAVAAVAPFYYKPKNEGNSISRFLAKTKI